MDPYKQFIQTEYENLRFLTVIPQKKYHEQPDFRLNNSQLVKKGSIVPNSKNETSLIPIIRAPPESYNQMVVYKPYKEDVHLLTTQLPPLLPQAKKVKQEPKILSQEELEELNNLGKTTIPTSFNSMRAKHGLELESLGGGIQTSMSEVSRVFNSSEAGVENMNTASGGVRVFNSIPFPRDFSPVPLEKQLESKSLDVRHQTGSSDSLALLPKPNTYKERTTKSTTYETDVKRHYINIDTKFRNKPELTTSTNFRWRLFRPIKNCVSLRVASVEIPNNFYTFSAAKKNITFLAKLSASPSYITLTLAEGNYMSTDFSDSLETLLKTLVDTNFTVSISNITGKLSIINLTNNFDIQFPREDTASTFDWGLGYYMGFNTTSYTNKQTLTSERVVNLVGDNYIMLQIGDYEGIEHEVEKQGLISATAKIILTSDKYAILFDNGSNFLSKEVMFQLPTNISAFNVRLIDSNNNDIDLMNTNYSFTLELVEIVNSRLYTNYSDNLLQNTDTPR